jgi:hypothetical protein
MDIVGMDALMRKMRGMNVAQIKQAMARALNAGAKIVHRRAESLAPRDTGLLRRTLKIHIVHHPNPMRMHALVQTAAVDYTGKAFYAGFIEYGHHAGKRGKVAAKALREQAKKLRGERIAFTRLANIDVKLAEGRIAKAIARKERNDRTAQMKAAEKALRERAKSAKHDALIGRKWIEPKPFMRPAFDQTRQQALARIQVVLAGEINKAVAR